MSGPRGFVVAVLALGIGFLAWLVLSRMEPSEVEGPNVVLVTIDTLRADRLSSYGYSRNTTPRLDALGRQGARFKWAYTPMPTTGPAHSSLFTSQYPLVHGVLQNGNRLESDRLLLSEILQQRGYQTAAVVSSFVLNHQFGYQQGFSFYDDDFRGADTSYKGVTSWEGHEVRGGFDRRANETTDRAIAWLDTHANRGPFFLWVHYFDPHHPYDPPAEYRRKYGTTGTEDLAWARSLYDAEVEFTDHEVGRFVDRLDELVAPDETLLIVTADHGEGLFDHGFMGHGPILFEETLRVPLLIRWKGRIEEGGTFADPVGLIDVAPTVLGLVGVETDRLTLQGEDLSGNLFEGKPTGDRRAMFFQRRRYQSNVVPTFDVEGVRFGGPLEVKGLKFAVRHGPWKYIEARDEATWELYNLVSDPGETTNVLDENSRVHRDLADRLMAWRKAQTELAVGDVQEIPEDVLRQLESLGYVK